MTGNAAAPQEINTVSIADSRCPELPWTWHRSRSPSVTWQRYTRKNCRLSCLLALSNL